MFNLCEIPKNNVFELFQHYEWDTYPRIMGIYQEIVLNFEEVLCFIHKHNGTNSVFFSHNQYPIIEITDYKMMPPIINYEKMFNDFDDVDKPENAQLDCIKLHEFLIEKDTSHYFTFSGDKGFHLYILMEPEPWLYRLDDNERDKDGKLISPSSADCLITITKTIQNYFIEHLGLRTLDPTSSDPKHLCRVLYSKHVNKDGKVSETHCIPLTEEMLKWNILDIIEYSKNPKFEIYPIYGHKKLKLSEMIGYLGFKFSEYRSSEIEEHIYNRIVLDSDLESILTIIEKGKLPKPCVINQLMSRNPKHHARLYFAILCKLRGIPIEGCNKLWEKLAQRMGYVDIHNYNHRMNQIRSAYRYSGLYKCDTLKRYKICIGNKCTRYYDIDEGN